MHDAGDVNRERGVAPFVEADQLEVYADFCKPIGAIERKKDWAVWRSEIQIEMFLILTETAGIIGFILCAEAGGVAILLDPKIVWQGDDLVVNGKEAREVG